MLTNAGKLFENKKALLKGLKKQSYEANTKQFWAEHMEFFFGMTDYVGAAEDKESASKEIAVQFVDAVENKFATGARKRIAGNVQTDLNFFMIYYVFPCILKTQHDQAKLIADSICEEWGKRFKNSKIGYTDYDSLYASFKEKIFGIF